VGFGHGGEFGMCFIVIGKWIQAKQPVKLHLYERGKNASA
jgi:hypothetical protein